MYLVIKYLCKFDNTFCYQQKFLYGPYHLHLGYTKHWRKSLHDKCFASNSWSEVHKIVCHLDEHEDKCVVKPVSQFLMMTDKILLYWENSPVPSNLSIRTCCSNLWVIEFYGWKSDSRVRLAGVSKNLYHMILNKTTYNIL